jgi:hypothetical protein
MTLVADRRGAPFDHTYAAWDALLRKHVRWMSDKNKAQVDYKGFAADRAALKAVLAEWSGVSPAAFAGFSREQQRPS